MTNLRGGIRINLLGGATGAFLAGAGLLALGLLRDHRHVFPLFFAVWGGTVACGLGLLFFLHRQIVGPLKRLAREIDMMRKTGRLARLPEASGPELDVIVEGFNHLAQQMEEQKRRLREHIIDLKRANTELDQLATLKDDFLVTINHQLRTPLTSLIEGVKLVRDGTVGSLNEDQQQLVNMMENNAVRLKALIDEVLDLSLIRSGRRPLARAPGDLCALLRRLQASWQETANARTIRLVCEELPPVLLDAQAIEEVMDQLLRNALRYTPERSEVVIEARVQDGAVHVSVRDQGPGLPPEQLTRLFQPFVHLQTPDSPGSQGSGLGLAFCRQVIERHRGSIRAESTLGQGTSMMFTLPIASTQFLFEDACRGAQEESEYDRSQFGFLLVRSVSQDASRSAAGALMGRVERVLRQNTHENDRFIWLDDLTIGIVAVADRSGLDAMNGRLHGVLDRAQLADTVCLASVLFPDDATTSDGLLEAARTRLRPVPPAPRHASGALSGALPIRRQAGGEAAPLQNGVGRNG